MAEDKKTFIQGKMNQDIDDRILPNGEYRSAQNIQVTTSEDSDVGSIQNVLGNTVVDNSILKTYDGVETIGCFFDEKNNRIFYFVTNYTCENSNLTGLVGGDNGPTTAEQADNNDLFCGIFMVTNADAVNLPSTPTLLVHGLFLNFSKTHLITGVNLIDDLLFFTDGLNQPRKINIKIAADNQPNLEQNEQGHYNTEDKISVAKFAPFMPPLLLDHETTTLNNNPQATVTDDNGNITNVDPTSSMELSTQNDFPEDFLREKFVRFSYRYRFIDGEYSTIAPFTQICFIPKTTSYNITQLQKVFKKGEVYFQDSNGVADGMVNNVTAVNLNIILPSKKITTDFDINAIEILYKESDNNLIRAVELKDINDISSSSGVFQYKYKSTLPYKTLPEDQLTRVYDNVPLSAKAQEIISNRIVYGNYVENRKLPNQPNLAGLNFSVGLDVKYDTTNTFGNANFNNYYLHKEYPFHSIKQRRTYEVGVVLSDRFGRQSPVLTSTSGLSSINVSAKNNLFHSSSWDTGLPGNVNSPGGVVSNNSPGNENYCGDALTITFNEAIPNAYAKSTLIPINNDSVSTVTYANNVYKTIFATDPNLQGGGQLGTGVVLGNLYYYAEDSIPTIGVTDFIYLDSTLQNVLTGQSVVYIHTGFSISNNLTSLHEIILNTTTGAVEVINIVTESIFQGNLLGAQTPVLVATSGTEVNTTNATVAVTPFQDAVVIDGLGTVFHLSIKNFVITDAFSVGEYLKGQDTDFVEILGIQESGSSFPFDQGLNIFTSGPASLSYKNYTGDLSSPVFDTEDVEKYAFFKYSLTPHGWYSYRVVVKQTEQEYNNVYTPGAISFDNDKDENKTYIPIAADSINKITRDIEFTNTQEQGLSTSKNRVFPKVIPDGDALSKQSDADLLDVISIGTAKEQGLKNDNNDVFDFVYESSKNTLMAQLPFGDNTISVGTSVDSGFSGSEQVVASTEAAGDIKLKNQGKTLIWTDSGTNTYATSFKEGNYLKGKFKDLVKIIEFTGPVSQVFTVTCDGAIDDVALGLDKAGVNGVEDADIPTSIKVRFYEYKYGIQDKISVFETKPFESVLDIYYETSTAGLIHELNDALSVPSDIANLELVDVDFKESVQFFDNLGVSLNQKIGRLKITDQFENELSFGTAPNQIATCEIVEQFGDGAIVDRFEIILNSDNGFFELLPKANSGGNFVYYPEEFPVSYSFLIKVRKNSDVTEGLDGTTLPINSLQLENVEPNTSATPNNFVALGSENEVVFEFIDETNGSSAGVEHNQKGLFYQDANLNENSLGFFGSFDQNITFGFDANNEVSFNSNELVESISIPARETLRDHVTGILRPEVRINNSTGEISTTNLYRGSFTGEFHINVIDSDDEGLKNLGDPEVGGKQHTHILNLVVNDGLIVLDPNNVNILETQNTGLVTDVEGNTVDIFNQGANSISAQQGNPMGPFNNYFSQSITIAQRDKGMSEIPAFGENGAGLFLFSIVKDQADTTSGGAFGNQQGRKTFTAYTLKIIDNFPKIKKYEVSIDHEETGYITKRRLYLNHWLAPSETGQDSTAFLGSDTRIPGGYIFISPSSIGDDPFGGSSNDINNKTDIDGGNDSNTRLNSIESVDPNEEFWDADDSFISDYGNDPETGTVGYFKVYGDDDGTITTGVAKPSDRQGSFNDTNSFIYKAQDVVTLGNNDYNVLYEISKPIGAAFGNLGNYTPAQLNKVFLCRRPSE